MAIMACSFMATASSSSLGTSCLRSKAGVPGKSFAGHFPTSWNPQALSSGFSPRQLNFSVRKNGRHQGTRRMRAQALMGEGMSSAAERAVSFGIALSSDEVFQAMKKVGHTYLHLADAVESAAAGVSSAMDAASSAVVAAAADAVPAAAPATDDGGFFGFFANGLEAILKLLEGSLASLHVPYPYGFSIILLTLLVKLATYPLTKKQVESTIAMQNLQPKIKAIQEKYKGDQERVQLETARMYKQAGVNPLAGCLPTLATLPIWIGLYRALTNVADEGLLTEGFFFIPSLAGPTALNGQGTAWLFPFINGAPPLGWNDTLAYLFLPVVLIISQFLSMKIMQPVQSDDPAQQQTQAILKFLPLLIGWFSLSVPSGLSLYWLTNNVLSTAQQVYLKQLGGAKPVVGADAGGIIDAGKAKRTGTLVNPEEEAARAARFKAIREADLAKKAARLKEAEAKKGVEAAVKEPEQQQRQEQEAAVVEVATTTAGAGDASPATANEEERDEDHEVPDTAPLKVPVPTGQGQATNGAAGGGSIASARSKRSKRRRGA